MDPVSVAAGAIKAGVPTLTMQKAMEIAWNVVSALKGLADVTTTAETKPAEGN